MNSISVIVVRLFISLCRSKLLFDIIILLLEQLFLTFHVIYLVRYYFCHILLFFKNPNYIISDFLTLHFLSLLSHIHHTSMAFAVIHSNNQECSTKTEGDLNNEREDRRLRQRLITHNKIHWCSERKERGEGSR